MGQANLAAQNATLDIDISGYFNGAVFAQTQAAVPAGAVFVLEVSGATTQSTNPPVKEFITPVMMTDPTTGTLVANLTGPSKAGYADVPGAKAVRLRRTDTNGGAAYVDLEFREG